MPIDLAELTRAERPARERILEFLAGNPKAAYSLVEVILGCEGYEVVDGGAVALLLQQIDDTAWRSLVDDYGAGLEQLLAAGRLRRVSVRGTAYFALKGT